MLGFGLKVGVKGFGAWGFGGFGRVFVCVCAAMGREG